jgi:signal transduction histidine kinase
MRLIHVLAHLVDNAREAMAGGGRLTISTDLLDVDEAMRIERPWLRAGAYMRLQVEDTGTGMAPALAARRFEPFVTTKPKGGGAGLGLATVYGLVKQSNGFVWVESAPQAGTRVVVLLPIDGNPATGDAPIRRPPRQSRAICRGCCSSRTRARCASCSRRPSSATASRS